MKNVSNNILTSESVGKGHPDKICDQISDIVLDECLKQDCNSRVACEVLASNRLIVIGGEISTTAYVDVVQCAWKVLKPLGYDENNFTILSNINKQSVDINRMVDLKDKKIGAGDQGMVFGYATSETKEFMPLPMVLSNELVKRTEKMIISKKFIGAKYDMKSQVSVEYEKGLPKKIVSMLMSIQHEKGIDKSKFKDFVVEKIMIPLAKEYKMNTDFKSLVNHAGEFVVGGPVGDTGLTGRKIIVDTYGGFAHHGGGAFSGKDYTKVDRTGAYFARWVAKNIVAAKLATKCEIQMSFCIGLTEPLTLHIDTFGTNKIDISKIYKAVNETFNFNISNIIKILRLNKPLYSQTSVYGHFGRNDLNLPWENINMIKKLQNNCTNLRKK